MKTLPSDAPFRYKALVGKLEHKEKGVLTNEYSKMYNKSKYAFMLDAPFEIGSQCCKIMKKSPIHTYQKETGRHPITAVMASESKLRTQSWLKNGCNVFNSNEPMSRPMSFWTEQDVLLYIKQNNLPICSVYGEVVADYDGTKNIDGQMSMADLSEDLGIFDIGRPALKTTGCTRTGCILCGFGSHLEKEGDERFVRLKETHPKLHGLLDVIQNNGITYREAIDWVNEHGKMHIKY